MPRPRSPIGTHGTITVDAVEYVEGAIRDDGKRPRRRLVVVDAPARNHDLWRARTRYRFDQGTLRQVEKFGPTRAKAEAALKGALTTIQKPSSAAVRRETRLKDLGERYLSSKAHRAPRTVELYEQYVRKVVIPAIGDLAVSEATGDRLQKLIDEVQAERGPGAAKNTRRVLSGMFALAVKSGSVTVNPVESIDDIEGSGDGAVAVPMADLAPLLAKVRGDNLAHQADLVDLVEFIAGTGVRITESLSLDWPDIDFKGGTVTIRKSKTTAGERTIVVPKSLMRMLKARKRDDGPVFPTPLGKRRDRSNTSADWQAVRERLELPNYTFHSFRKTVATALDQAGLSPRDIAEYLGHANPSITMNTYMSKKVGGSKAANALDSVLVRKGGK